MARKGKMTPRQCILRYKECKSKRMNWESYWQDVAAYTMPNRSDITVTLMDGTRRNVRILDNTAIQANELLAGALHGLLTNPNQQWFELSSGDDVLDVRDNVRKFLQDKTTLLHRVLNGSNFQTEVHQLYLDQTCFGTGVFATEEDDDTIVRFAARHIKEIYVYENSRGIIDAVDRIFKYNARQIVEEFGEENLSSWPGRIQDAYSKGSDMQFEILHSVYPRNILPGVFKSQMAYVSQYILIDGEVELHEDGFHEFLYAVPRWTKASGESYGRSPAMNALPDAKTLNKMTETVLIGAQKTVDPPLQAPDDGFITQIVTRPGGVSYYRAGTNDRIVPVFNDARIDFGFEAMKERRQRIREAFYVDQLQLQDGPQMTATEVLQRTEEQTRLLGPMLGRQQSEFLKPVIDRVFAICLRKGVIKKEEIPQELSGRTLAVQYSSVIARSQRISEGQNIGRTMQALAPFFQIDPTIADNFDADQIAQIVAKIYGFPQRGLKDQDKIAAIRQGRQQAQAAQVQQQQQQMQADQISKVAPAAAKLQAVS